MFYDEGSLSQELEKISIHFTNELKKIRTGRATMDMFDAIEVNAYGFKNKLTAVSNVVVEDAVSVRINVWDKSIMPNIDEALREASIGANIIMEGDFLRLRFNPLSEENRLESVKELKKILEEHKVSVRQIRQKYIKQVEERTGVSEDEQERDEKKIQDAIDTAISNLDKIAKNKEQALMSL